MGNITLPYTIGKFLGPLIKTGLSLIKRILDNVNPMWMGMMQYILSFGF